MFQKVIYKVIQGIKYLYEKLDMAYEQTYTDKETAHNLYIEKEKRINENKIKVIDRVKASIQEGYKKDSGDEMPDEVAEAFARQFYMMARFKGDIDEFGNFIGDFPID